MSDIEGWRKRIDEIDQQLVKLLNERSSCAVEIGQIKKKMNQPAWQPGREAEIPSATCTMIDSRVSYGYSSW